MIVQHNIISMFSNRQLGVTAAVGGGCEVVPRGCGSG